MLQSSSYTRRYEQVLLCTINEFWEESSLRSSVYLLSLRLTVIYAGDFVNWLCTKSRKFDSFSLRRSAYLRGLCVEMAVKRRDAKIRRRTAEKIHPKNSFLCKASLTRSRTFRMDQQRPQRDVSQREDHSEH